MKNFGFASESNESNTAPVLNIPIYDADAAEEEAANWGRSGEDCTSIFDEGNDLDASDAFDSWISGDYHC